MQEVGLDEDNDITALSSDLKARWQQTKPVLYFSLLNRYKYALAYCGTCSFFILKFLPSANGFPVPFILAISRD